MAKVFVFGLAHEVQGKKFQRAIDDECYRATLEYLITAYRVDAIFEEAAGHSPSDAQTIADSQSPQIKYYDVDPPRDEREKHGLMPETGHAEPIDLWSRRPCSQRFEKVAAHAARERFWLKRIGECNLNSAVFICGVSHTLSCCFRLIDAGHEVEKCITYLPYDRLCGHVLDDGGLNQGG